MKRLSLYFTGKCAVEVREEPLGDPGRGEALVETVCSAVSAGSELLFYQGLAPENVPVDETIPSLKRAVRYPLKYGYAAVGRVVSVGGGIDEGWLGRIVFALNPHESRFCAPCSELTPVPETLPVEEAVFLASMETAANLLMDGRPVIGERVVVLGQGVVGLLTTALLARMPLGALVTFDPLEARRERSLSRGAHRSLDPSAFRNGGDAADIFAGGTYGSADLPGDRDRTVEGGADLVYEISGSPEALDDAIRLAAFGARIVIGSWYGSRTAAVALGGSFFRRRLRIISSQVSTVTPDLAFAWSTERRRRVALGLIEEMRPSDLITHRFPFDRAGEAYELLAGGKGEALQVVLDYGG